MKKRILALALALTLIAACLTGCAKKGDGDALARVKSSGKLVIAMEGTWAPWTYHDESGELMGYDVEIGRAIAKKLGVEADFKEGEWNGLFAGLDGGMYDLVINGVDIDPARQEKYEFSIPYAYNRMAVIVRADDERITKMEDLAGMKTANTITSTYAKEAEKYGAEVIGVDDLAQTMELLIQSRIDATINSEMSYYEYMSKQPDAPIKIACLTEEATATAIPMRKGDEYATLRGAVNKALEELLADGTIAALSVKYFGVDISSN